MATISIVVLLLLAVVILIRAYDLLVSHALICIALGFYLSASGFAPTIQQVADQVLRLIASISV